MTSERASVGCESDTIARHQCEQSVKKTKTKDLKADPRPLM